MSTIAMPQFVDGHCVIVDASNGNAALGTAALTSETGVGFAGYSLLPVVSQNSGNTVLTADFNGDEIPDLMILGSSISVLVGNGDGTFTAAPSPSSDLPGAIAVGHFNGDDIPIRSACLGWCLLCVSKQPCEEQSEVRRPSPRAEAPGRADGMTGNPEILTSLSDFNERRIADRRSISNEMSA